MHWTQVKGRNSGAARGLGMLLVRGQRVWTGSNRDDEFCRWREAHGVDSGKGQEAKESTQRLQPVHPAPGLLPRRMLLLPLLLRL